MRQHTPNNLKPERNYRFSLSRDYPPWINRTIAAAPEPIALTHRYCPHHCLTWMGSPVLFLDQMSAILAPMPYLPRACLTPYLLLDSTTPSMSGICNAGQSHAQNTRIHTSRRKLSFVDANARAWALRHPIYNLGAFRTWFRHIHTSKLARYL